MINYKNKEIMAKQGKLIVVSAPSGTGKSTIISYLMPKKELNLHFSISATSRAPRGEEKNGVEYFFLTPDEFRAKIANDEFVEYEEVYTDKFYGTLKAQIDKQISEGENVVLDVDVHGAMNIKNVYGDKALTLFFRPPSIDELRRRLESRGTDAQDVIEKRLARAEYELSYEGKFEKVVVNDDLEKAKKEAEAIVADYLK